MEIKWYLVLVGLAIVKGHKTRIIVSENKDFQVPDLKAICEHFAGINISSKCWEQLNVLCENEDVLWTIFDASAKFPYSGLSYSSKFEYGNFDQCMSVAHHYEGGRILGKYCTGGLVIPDPSTDMSDPTNFFILGTCRPNECYASDFNTIIEESTNVSLPIFQDTDCYTVGSNSELSVVDIITLTIFVVFFFTMTVSTMYDIYLYYKQLKNPHPLLTAFSVLTNGRKLLRISKHSTSKEVIESFHGIRVISMAWIVAGHGFVIWNVIHVINKKNVDTWVKQRYAGYIATAPLSVDTFFYLSGFLLAFQYFKSKGKSISSQLMAVPKMYIHRYLRLTPALLMVYLLIISLYSHLGDGPLWASVEFMNKPCKKYAWSVFLYVQNYYNYDDVCIIPTWYISADMQMFLISPLVVIPLSYILAKPSGFRTSMALLLVLNLVCTFIPMATKLVFTDYTNGFDTHSRLINYLIGIMMGLFMRERIDKPFLYMFNEQRRHVINMVIWVFIVLEMLVILILYQELEMHYGQTAKSIFQSLMRPAWCIGLSWITYSCYHGYGGFVNWILCRPTFQVLGRLTYCIYLIHFPMQAYYALITRTRWFFSDYNAFYLFCGHYTVSVLVAVLWTLAFESPLIVIENYILGGKSKPGKKSHSEVPKGHREGALSSKDVEIVRHNGELPT